MGRVISVTTNKGTDETVADIRIAGSEDTINRVLSAVTETLVDCEDY